MTATHGGKGSKRRKEDSKKVADNMSKVKFGKRDKRNDNFKINMK